MIKHKYITYREDRDVYQVKITLKYGGERKIITRTTKNLTEALKARDELFALYRLDKNLLVDIHEANKTNSPIKKKQITESLLLEKLLCKWYETKKRPFLEKQSIVNYDNIVYDRLIPVFGKLNVNQVTQDMVQNYVNGLQETGNVLTLKPKGLSPKTVKNIVTVLHDFFESIVDVDLITKNPCRKLQYKKYLSEEKEPFTLNEIEKILSIVKRENYIRYLLFKLYFETGCRRAELLGLPWKNVDLQNGTIYIKQTLIREFDKSQSIKPYPKTGIKGIRTLPISKKMIFSLGLLKQGQQSNTKNFSDETLVFHEDGSWCMILNTITSYFKYALKKAGINRKVSLHTTRHTVSSNLINAGVPIPIVQEIGGWSTPNTLLAVYAHSDKVKKCEAMQKILFREG